MFSTSTGFMDDSEISSMIDQYGPAWGEDEAAGDPSANC